MLKFYGLLLHDKRKLKIKVELSKQNVIEIISPVVATMQSLIVLLAAFTIADISIDQVLAEDFIKRALENLQRHQNEALKISEDKYQEQRDDEDDDVDSNVRSLTNDDLALLELALKANEQPAVQKQVNRKETSNKKKQNYEKSHLDQLNGLGANDILVYDPESRTPIRTERQKNPLFDMLASSKYVDAALDEETDSSPIYVIVKADDRSKSDDSINDLLSSLLKSSSQNYRSNGRQEKRYKGFRVKDAYRRARDSNEKYSSLEMEDKRPLSRPRTYGGGGGGRTPIPYIRHRGDIYEKDG